MALTQISTGGIKDDAVTEAKLPANSVGNSEMKDDAVGVAELSATGTASSSTFLRGDNSWVTPTDTNTQLAFANDANNRVVTGDGSGGLNGEANLTFDGTKLLLGTTTEGFNYADEITVESSTHAGMTIRSGTSSLGTIAFSDGTSGTDEYRGYIQYDHNTNVLGLGCDAGQKISIASGGNVTIDDGDLVIGTAGHGIDFSAVSHATGMTSEILDGYEEGTWTPDFFYHSSVSNVAGHYTKIGRMVYAYFTGVYYSNSSNVTQYISNLPFTSSNNTGGNGGVARGYQDFDIQNGPIYWIEPNTTKIFFYKDNGVGMPASDGNGNSFRGLAIYHTDS